MTRHVLPILKRARWSDGWLGIAGGVEPPTYSFIPARGRTLHLGGVCVNRIGTVSILVMAGFLTGIVDAGHHQPAMIASFLQRFLENLQHTTEIQSNW